MKKKAENKKEENKSVNDLIIDEAVKQFKEGKIKNGLDVTNFLDSLLQPLMQKLLDTELENHLDYSKYEHTKEKKNSNSRNGYCKAKKVRTEYGNIEVKTPRDRNATFEPVIIEKGQTRLTGFEDKCIALYAKGMSLRDIEKTLKEIYGVKIGKDEITTLISAVNEETEKWRNRKLKSMYVFTYADCLYVPIKDDITSDKKAVYIIIGVDANGLKDILGMWIDNTESSTFWTNIFEDLKERGVEDILYMSSDGIAGFKSSLERVFPKTQAQRCVVHLVRNLYSICPRKEAKNIIADYKKIYTSSNLEEAEFQLDVFSEKYKEQKRIVRKTQDSMQYLEPLFELPQEIRKCIYTSNPVESVNSALRKVTRGKGAFPSESSVFKVLYLRIKDLSEKWKKPIQNWKVIQPQLIYIFGDRYTKHLTL
ncbi:MAG: IS256 family transposase [Clostridia bacterium]|nr:IS256 family transposase [Clostridia bacterium]